MNFSWPALEPNPHERRLNAWSRRQIACGGSEVRHNLNSKRFINALSHCLFRALSIVLVPTDKHASPHTLVNDNAHFILDRFLRIFLQASVSQEQHTVCSSLPLNSVRSADKSLRNILVVWYWPPFPSISWCNFCHMNHPENSVHYPLACAFSSNESRATEFHNLMVASTRRSAMANK